MLKTTTTKSAENLPSDMIEDTEVGSETSFTTRLAKYSPLNMVEDAKVGGNGDGGINKTVKRLPTKKPSKPTGYFTSLHSKKITFL